MQINLPNGLDDCLLWLPEKGLGFHPRLPMSYEGDYWASYLERDASDMGEKLTKARLDFVKSYIDPSEVIDIGIGGGRFVREADCRGYDVSKQANEWLDSHDRFCSPYASPVRAITCWDSLEHIDKPWKLLKQVQEWLFVSLPIFVNPATITSSKHYKPGEHLWYFTHKGFIDWCKTQEFDLMEYSHIESELGRDGIVSYAFKRQI